jgi:hypothetical protein
MRVKKLNEAQTHSFDMEYINENRWSIIKRCIDNDFYNKKFSFLDIGGGNGIFTDKILNTYNNSTGTIVDNSEFLINKNQSNNRKKVILDSVENLDNILNNAHFDLVFINWVLHHLVAESYAETEMNVVNILTLSSQFLNADGRISIFEDIYDGIWFDNLPSHLIYHLTSLKSLAGLMNMWGANTAGVGVCFRSKANWMSIIQKSKLRMIEYTDDDNVYLSFPRRLFLHVGRVRPAHFWLAKDESLEAPLYDTGLEH